MTVAAELDLAAVKARQQATWASGDFAEIATLIVPVAECLCDAADLRAGSAVLDVACGGGHLHIRLFGARRSVRLCRGRRGSRSPAIDPSQPPPLPLALGPERRHSRIASSRLVFTPFFSISRGSETAPRRPADVRVYRRAGGRV